MFHANAWGLPYACAAVGAKLVFPGPNLDPESLLDLMAAEKVTCAGGVPTIWLGILALLDQDPKQLGPIADAQMVVGGSAAPPAMIDGFEKRHGLDVTHAWGMTETDPLGHASRASSADLRTPRRGAARAPRDPGLRGPVRGDAARRRGRRGPAVGRRDDGRARGARALGGVVDYLGDEGQKVHGRRLVQDRRRGDHRRRGLPPASPTARRT